ncbi:MAG TPA: class I SAM-dependent methyltransferase [Candidatus Babeliales bacterium]|nr:class I SAM-dependent methyltransferase [Candidatus Babeliales bacterium]
MNQYQLKESVKKYWNKASCGTGIARGQKFSRDYFQQIEEYRYQIEPEIFAFAQFTRFRGKRVLEVGVGAGTDFLQWVRAGAKAYGIDLTSEAIENVSHRLMHEGLLPYDLQVADAENIPYPDNSFDLVYSWGVIHHSPDTVRCLGEIIRVCRPGGVIKLMIYHRYSLFAFYRYLLTSAFIGKPFRSLRDVLFYDQESVGTKAYTFREVKQMLGTYPVKIQQIKATVSYHDLLLYKSWPFRFAAYILASVLGWNRCGWFMTIELQKNNN